MSALTSTNSPRRSPRLSKGIFHIPNYPTTSPSQSSHPRVNKNEPHSQTLYLRVNSKFLSLIPAAAADQPNPEPLPPLPGTSGNLVVTQAELSELRKFAGDTVDWLIQVARLIFDPLGASSIYTFTTETAEL